MKVVILAGGKGTRIREYSSKIPKPMVKVNGIPIIVHIMKHYSNYGFDDFVIALGYKGNTIRNYFKKKKISVEYKSSKYWIKFNDRRQNKNIKKYNWK